MMIIDKISVGVNSVSANDEPGTPFTFNVIVQAWEQVSGTERRPRGGEWNNIDSETALAIVDAYRRGEEYDG